jgi:hypothetical protein
MEAQAYQHWTVTYEKNDLVPDAIVRCAFYASTLLSITVEMNNAIKGMGASRKRGEYAGSMLFELWVDRRPDVLVDRRPSTTVYRPGAASRDFPKK